MVCFVRDLLANLLFVFRNGRLYYLNLAMESDRLIIQAFKFRAYILWVR